MSAGAVGAGQYPWGRGRVCGSTQPPLDYQASRKRELAHRLHLGYGFSESHFQDSAESCAARATQGQGTGEPPACPVVPLWEG